MRTALALFVLFSSFFASSAVQAQSTVTVEVSGTIDDTAVTAATLPAGLQIGTTYTAVFEYVPSLASADLDADPDAFDSVLDLSTTQFTVNAAGQTWQLPSTDPNPSALSVRQVVQNGSTLGRYAVRGAARPSTSDFPGLILPQTTADGRIRLVLEDANLWIDTILPAQEHLSSSNQLDATLPGAGFFELSCFNQGKNWRVLDFDPTVTITVELDPVSREASSWGSVKSTFQKSSN